MSSKQSTPLTGEGWVIGIGASAGGLEALTAFISNIPETCRASFIVAQHLAPHAKSMMVELLGRQSKFPVVAAHDKEEIRPATIYITPPNFDISIDKGHIYLQLAGEETRPKPSIDSFFRSLAKAYADHSVGIILSGTGTDGSHGVRAIRAAGGVTLAQDDVSAKYDGMPKAAVDTGSVDSILTPEAMAKSLPTLLNEHHSRLNYRTIDNENIAPILDLIKEKLGTDFQYYKASTIQRRIAKRMAHMNVDSFRDYLSLLEKKPSEIDLLSQEMLVSVTTFFRDPEVFSALKPYLSNLVSKKALGEEIRVWVAGCASGEEAYTLAILLNESCENQHKNMAVKVFATDLDHDAIFEGRTGIYDAESVENVPTNLRDKYFEPRGPRYEVCKRLRDMVIFAKQDMIQNPPFVKVDLISCRNVMIYFEAELQKRVLEIFHYALNPSAILLLGKSEGPTAATGYFETADRTAKIYTKINIASKNLPPSRPPLGREKGLTNANTRRVPSGPTLAEMAYDRIFRSTQMAAVVIDEDSNVLQILGDPSPYLGFFTGQVENKLPNLLPKNVGVEIPILIRRVERDGESQKSRVHRTGKGNQARAYRMVVRTLKEERTEMQAKPLYVVTFEPQKAPKESSVPSTSVDGELPHRISELEQELYVTREHLQTVIEELGVSNEELQSVNEELSSTNEELQASSEELETTNEELQSTNEELTTLNDEMTIKSSDLKSANLGLENVQNSIGSPMVVVDRNLRVVRYNQDALKVFNLNVHDMGRSITRVSSTFEIPDFEERLRESIEGGRISESIVDVPSGIYQMRILPSYDDLRNLVGAIVIFIDNTDLIRAQERLTSSDRRLRAIIDSSTSIIFVKDTLGRYILMNHAFLEFFKLTEDKVLGRTDRELFRDSTATQLRDADLEVFLKRVPNRAQEDLVRSNGDSHTFLLSRFPLFDGQNTNPYAVGTVAIDISAQVNAQKELHQSESRYRSMIEDQPVFVCRHDVNGALTYINGPYSSFFGVSLLNNTSFYDTIDPRDRKLVQDEVRALNPRNLIAQYEFRVRAGQDTRWVRWIHRAILDAKGEVSEYQGVGFDVTESKVRSERLAEKDAIYTGIFSNTIDFLSVFKIENGEIVLESFNRTAEKAFGPASTQLAGRNLEELLNPETAESVRAAYRRCIDERRSQVFEEQFVGFGQTKYYSTTLVPIAAPDGSIERLAAVSRDISAHKKIENDLRKARDASEIANRSKSDFLASMSHELRTPLNVVLGMSHILAETELRPEQRGFVDTISRSGRVLLSLIEDVLDVSKIEAGKLTLQSLSFSVKSVTDELIDQFRHLAAPKGLDIVYNFPQGIGRALMGDPMRLRQVLTNLLSNALKFTDNGSITVEIEARSESKDSIQEFFFRVTDTGIGIAGENHGRLFQRFSQIDSGNNRKFGGTGLGLMISRQLVDMMGGEIGFESEKGKGSQFWFTVRLPLAKHQPREDKMPKAIPQTEAPTRNLNILAVDDNADSQTVLELLLKKLGHEVTIAGSGENAIDQVVKNKYDLVLMDIQMPGMDGYEATREIRSGKGSYAQIPIVALTANAMSGDDEKCFQAGMDDYLTKPIEMKALSDLLNKWSQRI